MLRLRYVYVMFRVMCNGLMCNVGQSLVLRLVWPKWRHKMWNRDGCYDLPWLIIYLAAVSLIEIRGMLCAQAHVTDQPSPSPRYLGTG